MGKECGAWVSRRLWGGGNTSPLKTTAWEARSAPMEKYLAFGHATLTPHVIGITPVTYGPDSESQIMYLLFAMSY